MYPRDAITISATIKTAGTYTILPASTTPYTLLSGTLSGTGAGGDEQGFVLGSSSIYTKGDVSQQVLMHLVYQNLPLIVVKTGNASTTFAITYVPRNRKTTYDPPLIATTSTEINIASSTSLYSGPTYQEFLFVSSVIIAILSLQLWRFLFRKRKEV